MTLAAVLLLAAIASPAVTVGVRPAVEGQRPCAGVLKVEPEGGRTNATTQTTDIGADGRASLALPDDAGTWRASLVSEQCWAEPAVFLRGADSVTLDVWPKRTLRGRLAAPRALEVKGVRMTLQSPSPRSPAALRAPVTEECSFADGAFACGVPGTMLDIRLESEGFAPVYLWDIDVSQGNADVGALPLIAGASVSGWVDTTRAGTTEVEVTLTPDEYAVADAPAARLTMRSAKIAATARGFFQFRGVAPGTYVVTARGKNASPARLQGVDVSAGREHTLHGSLVLDRLGSIEVTLSPAVTPAGTPWRIDLRARSSLAGESSMRTRMSADEGRWTRSGLAHGTYALAVVANDGSIVARRDVEVVADTSAIHVAIGMVPIVGRISVGRQPLRAELRFETADAKVTLISDGGGAFAGTLPNDGRWRVMVTPSGVLQRIRVSRVDVRVADGETAARVEIDLPEGRIEGKVVDVGGRPVGDVEVLASRGSVLAGNAATDASGRFSLLGLEHGAVTLYAKKNKVESGDVLHVVTDAQDSPVTIVVRERLTVHGTVTMAGGTPVTGALVRYLVHGIIQPPEVTGPRGEFTLSLPPGERALSFVVLARALPVKIAQAAIDPDRPLAVIISPLAGRLTVRTGDVPPWPSIRRGTVSFAMPLLFEPHEFGPPRELRDGAWKLILEAGDYSLCTSSRAGSTCIAAPLAAGAHVSIDARGLWNDSVTSPVRSQ